MTAPTSASHRRNGALASPGPGRGLRLGAFTPDLLPSASPCTVLSHKRFSLCSLIAKQLGLESGLHFHRKVPHHKRIKSVCFSLTSPSPDLRWGEERGFFLSLPRVDSSQREACDAGRADTARHEHSVQEGNCLPRNVLGNKHFNRNIS